MSSSAEEGPGGPGPGPGTSFPPGAAGEASHHQSHYSLRWNNHQNHVLRAFEALLHAELLVDVTLVCAESSLKAHKLVLSICSPFFEGIFAEHPCKHPVIVLKDFAAREIKALLDFMYRGEVRVGRKDLAGLMRAAESLQVRGLASTEPRPASPPSTPPHSPSPEPGDDHHQEPSEQLLLTARPHAHQLHPGYHHHHHHHHHSRELQCSSPLLPRRKQARPRRRSGELPQDLSSAGHGTAGDAPTRPPSRQSSEPGHPQHQAQPVAMLRPVAAGDDEPAEDELMPELEEEDDDEEVEEDEEEDVEEEEEEVAENLSMRRAGSPSSVPAPDDHHRGHHRHQRLTGARSESEAASSPRESPIQSAAAHLHPDASFADIPAAGLTAMSALALTPPHHPGTEYLASLGQFAAQWLPQPHDSPPTHRGGQPAGKAQPPGQQQQQPAAPAPAPGAYGGYAPSESPLAARGPVPCFPLDAAAGLFPGAGGPLDLHDGSFKTAAEHAFHGLFGPPAHPAHPGPLHHHHHHHPQHHVAPLGGPHHHHHHPQQSPQQHQRPPGSKRSKKSRDQARRWAERGLPGLCRPKGQHSAPRGGPPRSWTNADLTEALTMVWNKKMTTSQASRIYGIPYNSLLMYVRGKYGKSLKLEELRRDCVAGEVMNTLNNNVKGNAADQAAPAAAGPGEPGYGPPPPPQVQHQHHALLAQGLGQGFFPDFGAAFPVPVSMVHLLPQSDQQQQQQQAEPTAQPPHSPSPGPGPGPEGPPAPSAQTPTPIGQLLQQHND